MKPLSQIKSILALSFIFLIFACGGAGTTDGADEAEEAGTGDEINTDKLIGTPFEGYETGDDFDWDFFLCNQYRTETIDELPIQIFTAFFTESEEETIQEGIDVANETMGGTFYEMTDAWSDGVRVIYLVDEMVEEIGGEIYEYSFVGLTRNVESRFNETMYAEVQASDWKIELTANGINKWVVAHELGHASGIFGHYLIDYENDTFTTDLEEDSLMSDDHSRENPALTDYTFMMQQQAQIIENHLGEQGETGVCTE